MTSSSPSDLPSQKPRKPKTKSRVSLVSKLAEVQASISGVAKTGYNDYQKYSYAEEAAIVEACRQQLAARHIMIIPSIDSVLRDGDLTTIHTSYRIIDGESGEEILTHWAGTGSDKQDKGLPKAATTSQKYLLLKLFLIPTGSQGVADDVEHPAHESTSRDDEVYQGYLSRCNLAAQTGNVEALATAARTGTSEQQRRLTIEDWTRLKALALTPTDPAEPVGA